VSAVVSADVCRCSEYTIVYGGRIFVHLEYSSICVIFDVDIICRVLDEFSMKGSAVVYDGEVGGWGRDPKKCTGSIWGMGSSTI